MSAAKHMRIAAGEGERRSPLKFDFSNRALESIKAPAKDRAWVYDSRQTGLCLMITANDSRAFYVLKKVNGRTQRIRLGDFEDIGTDQARKLCAKTLGQIAEGIDPQAEKRAIRAETTLGELWDLFTAKAKLTKRSFNTDESRWKHHLKAWSSRRLSDITTGDISALHTRIGKDKPITANRVLALLSTMYNRAKPSGYTGGNPCDGVEKFAENSRERFLNRDELQRFAAALEVEGDPYGDLFYLCLWTGARQGNVRSMRWAELDLKLGTWTIPASKFKTNKPLVVHLSPPALITLKRRKEAAVSGVEWVFPQADKPEGFVTNPTKAWKRVCKAAKLDNLKIHDLRHTNASYQLASGAGIGTIKGTLGHASITTTQRYSHLDLSSIKTAVDAATLAMQEAMKGGGK
jgi:integrase